MCVAICDGHRNTKGKHMKNLSNYLEGLSSELDALVVEYLNATPRQRAGRLDIAKMMWAFHRKTSGFVHSPTPLFTHPANQAKLGKSDIYTLGLTLQHADVSGFETCAWRTASCTATCVLDNGNGRYDKVQHARNVKTQFLHDYPRAFVVLLVDELIRTAHKYKKVLVRLNVNSDLRWYAIIPSLFNGSSKMLRNVDFYDYTKNPAVLRGNGMVAKRYRLCYSLSENDARRMNKIDNFVGNGGTVAVVTVRKKSEQPPTMWRDRPVVDGDITDDRFSERGVFVDLSAKGKARKLTVGGFVRDIKV